LPAIPRRVSLGHAPFNTRAAVTAPGETKAVPGPLHVRIAGALMAALCGLAVLPAGLLAFMTVFMFDAPGSQSIPFTWTLAGGFWAAPLILLFAAMRGLAAMRSGRVSDLGRACLLVVGLVAYLVLAWWLLETACSGRFDCPT
jgi:hypothetical protein